MAKSRKKFLPKTKLDVVKKSLLGKAQISDMAEDLGVQPSQIYQWQQQLFTNGELAFERKNDRRTGNGAAKRYEDRISELEAELARKDSVIAEVTGEFVKLKKLAGRI